MGGSGSERGKGDGEEPRRGWGGQMRRGDEELEVLVRSRFCFLV